MPSSPTKSAAPAARAAIAALAMACTLGCSAGPEAETLDELAEAAEALGPAPLPPPLLPGFPVQYNVPAELVTGLFTGWVPVTFGIPFPPGDLPATHRRRLWTAAGALDADFEVTATWPDGSTKWLLVDAVVQLTNGQAPVTTFEHHASAFTETAPTEPITSTLLGVNSWQVTAAGKTYQFNPGHQGVGAVELRTVDVATNVAATYRTESTSVDGSVTVSREKNGKVRTTIKVEGPYRSANGTKYGKFITRYRLYSKVPYARVFHTMVWDDTAQRAITSLALVPEIVPGPGATFEWGRDGGSQAGAADAFQTAAGTVTNAAGTPIATRLDGWAQASWTLGAPMKQFVGLRWPWQQFPVRTRVNGGGVHLHAIGPRPGTPMKLGAADVASPSGPPMHLETYETFDSGHINFVEHYNDQAPHVPQVCNPACGAGLVCDHYDADPELECGAPVLHVAENRYHRPLSPRGVAKTYEYLVWPSTASIPATMHGVPPQQRNVFLQTPVYAYADPVHAVRAGLPSPSAPVDGIAFPVIEEAISNVFDFATRQSAVAGDFGTFNFGDLQYEWSPANPARSRAGRYWMNQGKGWSIVPWLLYLRSGDRKYLQNAEMHGRHLMDVDTCHLHNANEDKWVGGTTGYAPFHFGEVAFPGYILNESEYLGMYYRLTGYERAWDVITERQLAALMPPSPDYSSIRGDIAYLDDPLGPLPPNLRFNRQHYHGLGELAALYEQTNNPQLAALAGELVQRLVASQARNGWLPGIKTNFWFSDALLRARRAFPAHAPAIDEVLRKFEEHLGNYLMPSISPIPLPPGAPSMPGTVEGPTSLWTLITLEQGGAGAGYLEVAAKTALAQALSVYPKGGEYRGLTALDIQYLGHQVRGWTATMARLRQLPVQDRPVGAAPMPYFHSGLATHLPVPPQTERAWDGRHVLYVLEPSDTAFTVDLDFSSVGLAHDLLIRIHRPDGVALTPIEAKTDARPVETFTGYPVIELEALSKYQKGVHIPIAADGVQGAYAIEVYSNDLHAAEVPAIWARSSLGKVVHYIPSLVERTDTALCPTPTSCPPNLPGRNTLYQIYKQDGGTVAGGAFGPSHADSGQFWFMPKSAGEGVELGFFSYGLPMSWDPEPAGPFFPVYNPRWQRVVAFRADGTEVGATQIVATDTTDPFHLPVGSACSFEPNAAALHSAVTTNGYWHFSLHTAGALPFLSSTQAQWFDPRPHTSKQPEAFIPVDL
jgi:hypothetical protein